jgi:hypothetical protein
MSKAITTGRHLHLTVQREEAGAHHIDDNSDDVKGISLIGLAVEIELPSPGSSRRHFN